MGRIITVTSGKGGVGKTNICLNLALYLGSKGLSTCLFDADLGLANINILLGLQPELTLKDAILTNKTVEDILIRDYQGIDIFPGSSGVEELANLDKDKAQELVHSLSTLGEYDFLLFDTSAGLAKNVLSFCLSSPEVVVVITPEPTSLTDAYSLLKVLLNNGFNGKFYVVVNQCKDMQAAKAAYGKFKGAVVKYLKTEILPLGVIFEDSKVGDAVKEQSPFLIEYPQSNASQCLKKIGDRLLSGPDENLEIPSMQDFWRKCMEVIKTPLRAIGKSSGDSDKGKNYQNKSRTSNEAGEPSSSDSQPGSPVDRQKNFSEVQPVHAPLAGNKDTVESVNVGLLLGELVKGISSVSEELRRFREAMEGNDAAVGGRAQADTGTFEAEKKPVVKLDIQAFLAKKGIKEKG